MIPAEFWQPIQNGIVECLLCPHQCRISKGKRGICGVRLNQDGKLYSLNSDRLAAAHIDPIEKKPLYHFLPGSLSFSIAAAGCNFSCRFCQNHEIAQVQENHKFWGEPVTPDRLQNLWRRERVESISYTYTEPTVYFELMRKTAELARRDGLANIMVTNGYISMQAISAISSLIDAANIDLKAFNDDFYHKYCGGRLAPVLDSISEMKSAGIWIEVTTLLIPGLNDDPLELRKLADFLVSINPEIPWHVSRFFPQNRMLDIAPTPAGSIFQAVEIGKSAGIQYVYTGNIHSAGEGNTHCPGCGALLIRREGYSAVISGITEGECSKCKIPIAGNW